MNVTLRIFVIFLLTFGAAGCKLSPHGGIVPVWEDTAHDRKISGGNGSSFEKAVRISNGRLSYAKSYEIGWLWQKKLDQITYENFKADRVRKDGRTFDVVTLPGSTPQLFYFDVTDLSE